MFLHVFYYVLNTVQFIFTRYLIKSQNCPMKKREKLTFGMLIQGQTSLFDSQTMGTMSKFAHSFQLNLKLGYFYSLQYQTQIIQSLANLTYMNWESGSEGMQKFKKIQEI